MDNKCDKQENYIACSKMISAMGGEKKKETG